MPRLTDLLRAGRAQGAYLGKALSRVAGVPDYEAYLARHREVHPDVPPMSPGEFQAWALARRYASPGARCC